MRRRIREQKGIGREEGGDYLGLFDPFMIKLSEYLSHRESRRQPTFLSWALACGHQRSRVGELAGRAGRSAWVACWCSSCSSCEVFLATAECFLQRIARDAKKCTLYRPRRSCRCAPLIFHKSGTISRAARRDRLSNDPSAPQGCRCD